MIRKVDIQAACLRADGVVAITGSTVADVMRIIELVDGNPEMYTISAYADIVLLKPTPYHLRKPAP